MGWVLCAVGVRASETDLHATGEAVPGRAVGDATGKVLWEVAAGGLCSEQGGGAQDDRCVTGFRWSGGRYLGQVHRQVGVGVGGGQLHEDVVVGRAAVNAAAILRVVKWVAVVSNTW